MADDDDLSFPLSDLTEEEQEQLATTGRVRKLVDWGKIKIGERPFTFPTHLETQKDPPV